MYNLLVSGHEESWEKEPFVLEINRCVQEYTDKEIIKRYGELNKPQIDEILRFPCIFAYEAGCKKDPKFGLIRNIKIRQRQALIEYEIFALDKFLSYLDLSEMIFPLDIWEWEINRTHWAIKDISLSKELASKGIQLPRWARREAKAVDISKHEFDVALSFPGEIREYIKPIAEELERLVGPDTYFYDDNYRAQLARPSLDVLLQDIYRIRSKLVVVFLCEKYQEKKWCGIEFRAIREIIMDRKNDKVMFIKMDDGDVQGVFKTDGYIDGRIHSPDEVAGFIQERVSLLP